MKLAFLYSGQVRGWEETFASQAAHLIAPAEAAGHAVDLYCHVTSASDAARLGRLPCICRNEQEPTLAEPPMPHGLGTGARNIQGCLRQLWCLQRAWAMLPDPHAYDLIVRIRYDLLFLGPPSPRLHDWPTDAVSVPRFASWWGFNDCFAAGPPALMDNYMNRLPRLEEYCRAFPFHMELFLKWALADAPVNKAKVIFDKMRDDGSRDGVFWGQRWGDVPLFD